MPSRVLKANRKPYAVRVRFGDESDLAPDPAAISVPACNHRAVPARLQRLRRSALERKVYCDLMSTSMLA